MQPLLLEKSKNIKYLILLNILYILYHIYIILYFLIFSNTCVIFVCILVLMFGMQMTSFLRRITLSSVAFPAVPYFSTCRKHHYLLNIKCVLSFPLQFLF